MKTLRAIFFGLAIAGLASCERRVVVEIEGLEPAEVSPEAAAIEADLKVANDAFERLSAEIDSLDVKDPRRHAALMGHTQIMAEFRDRNGESPAEAAKWYREQLEGKTLDDMIARHQAEQQN